MVEWGVVTGPPVWCELKPPLPRSIGGELGAERQSEALLKGLAPTLLPAAPHLWTPSKKDREPRQRGKPTAQP